MDGSGRGQNHANPIEINVPAEIQSSHLLSIIRNVLNDPTFWAEHYVVSFSLFLVDFVEPLN